MKGKHASFQPHTHTRTHIPIYCHLVIAMSELSYIGCSDAETGSLWSQADTGDLYLVSQTDSFVRRDTEGGRLGASGVAWFCPSLPAVSGGDGGRFSPRPSQFPGEFYISGMRGGGEASTATASPTVLFSNAPTVSFRAALFVLKIVSCENFLVPLLLLVRGSSCHEIKIKWLQGRTVHRRLGTKSLWWNLWK